MSANERDERADPLGKKCAAKRGEEGKRIEGDLIANSCLSRNECRVIKSIEGAPLDDTGEEASSRIPSGSERRR